MTIPESVREAAGRFAMTEASGGYLSAFRADLARIAEFAVPVIQSGAIPSQEVIDAIRRLICDVTDGRKYMEPSSLRDDVQLVGKWLAKVEQKEESSE